MKTTRIAALLLALSMTFGMAFGGMPALAAEDAGAAEAVLDVWDGAEADDTPAAEEADPAAETETDPAAAGETDPAPASESERNTDPAAAEIIAASLTVDGVFLRWRAIDGAAAYRVYRRLGDGDWQVVGETAENAFTDTTALSGRTYTYAVCALTDGDAAPDGGVTVTFLAAPVLKRWANLAAGVKITWKQMKTAESFLVYRRAPGGSWKLIATVEDPTAAAYIDETAVGGKSYEYTVRACRGDVTSACDDTGLAVIRVDPPALTDAIRTDGGVKVKWEAVTGATGYNVYRKVTGEGWVLVGSVPAGTLQYTDASAPQGRNTFMVRAVIGDTEGAYTPGGIKQRGFVKVDGNTYFIKKTGGKARGWLSFKGNTYYMDADGVMQTGWQVIDGVRYYFYKTSHDDGRPVGAMAVSTTVGNYDLDENGVASLSAAYIMTQKAQSFSSSTKYLILVDTTGCKTAVFEGSYRNWTLKFLWDCTPGKESTPTPTGSYSISGRGYYFVSYGSWCYYYTIIVGGYYFHSTLYNADGSVQDSRLGMNLSHGCVRLAIANAKWLYDNVPNGTRVYIYR